MTRRFWLTIFPAALALSASSCAKRQAAAFDPETFTELTISDADSMDPAYAYDVGSDHIILNVYEPLFFFDGASTEKLIPLAAEEVPSRENGLIAADGRTYTIPIRKGVRFHDGTPMTPEDVRYSILRFILQDRDAGPSPLLLTPLLGYSSTRDDKGNIKESVYKDAVHAVQVEGNNVVLRLPKPFAPLLTVLASWAPVVSESWAAKNGDWDGTEAAWKKFNNPLKQSSPFFEKANGTGPFKLERWDRKTKEFVLLRNDDYWRGPARLKRVVVKGINEFETRKLMLAAGDADNIYASEPQFSQVQNIPGVEVIDRQPTMLLPAVAYFTFHIDPTGNPYIGSGKLDGQGIPPDFFADKDIRKAFAYSFDYQGYVRDVFHDKGAQGTGCVPSILPGHNPDQKTYAFDPAKAAQYFKKALGGKVWDEGFRFTLIFNSGNAYRQTLCEIFKRNIEAANPKFHIEVRPIEWPTFLDSYTHSKLPIFVMGWQADYPDPDDFAFPMMDSEGAFPQPQKYKNPEADRLIRAAISETDPAKRKKLYYRIQEIEYEDVPHIVVAEVTEYRTQRDWVKGWYHNPVFPNSPYSSYFYTLYKEKPAVAAAAQKPEAGRRN